MAAGALGSLRFLETHLVLQLHMHDSLVAPFDQKNSKHIAEQRDVLTVQMWRHLYSLSKLDDEVKWPAMNVLWLVFSNLRFEHARRTKLVESMCAERVGSL